MDENEKAALESKVAELEASLKNKDEELSKAVSDKNTTVEELKSLRASKQEIEAKLSLLESKKQPESSQGNVDEKIKEVFAEKEKEKLKETRSRIEEKFRQSHTEFNSDNDPGGIKFEAYKKHLSRINVDSMTSEEDIQSAYEDAFILMNKDKLLEKNSQFNPYASTVRNSSGDPKTVVDNKLTSTERQVIDQLGWTEERYMKIKKSRPGYVASLLSQISKNY